MKKLLYGFLIAASGLGITGCNNGDYDAKPNRDLSDKINPLKPKGGVHTGFDWGGEKPMSMEVNGNFWKADAGTYVNGFTFPGDPTEYVIVSGLKDGSNPKTQLSLLLEKSKVSEGAEIDISWTKGGAMSSASYVSNLDSAFFGTIHPESYAYHSGFSEHGKVRILHYSDTLIKGMFYFLGRNPPPDGFYVNIQKGYFEIKP